MEPAPRASIGPNSWGHASWLGSRLGLSGSWPKLDSMPFLEVILQDEDFDFQALLRRVEEVCRVVVPTRRAAPLWLTQAMQPAVCRSVLLQNADVFTESGSGVILPISHRK
jgi:hypothetical protein